MAHCMSVCQSHLFIDAARFHPTEVHRRDWWCRRTVGKDPCVLLTLVVDEKVVNQLEPSATRGVSIHTVNTTYVHEHVR